MRVVVALDHRFLITPDGVVWTKTQFAYSFWMRYLEVFESVHVVSRTRQVSTVSSEWKRADGKGISFAVLPDFVGPWQYLLQAWQIQQAARNAVSATDAVILRTSSTIGDCIEPLLLNTNHPYGVEVVNDSYDVFAPGSVKHPLRTLFRWWFTRQQKRQCAGACAAAYVTEFALQRRYPPAFEAFSTNYSDIELPNSAFVTAPRSYCEDKHSFSLITVGTMAQLYKAPNVLINAIAICVQEGIDLNLILVGDGKHRKELEAQAVSLGLGERVHFRGQLTAGDAVRAELDRSDLFVLPSYQEGLPRAMIEAMARALPCIGSNVGGIPELLPSENMVSPGDSAVLASKIREVVTNPKRMELMSMQNLEIAKQYRDEILREKRFQFYQYVKNQTEIWLKQTDLLIV